ncbi:MAG: hypothetical protein C4536_05345 [Actinobacteria bacterium]|nr:MAG: hypothetical protein C4536_05345 [Actinomycetota bacterium]
MRQTLREEGGFSLLEYVVSVAIVAFILVMGILVWSNVKSNAYESRARKNFEYAVSEIRSYWDLAGQSQGSYQNLVAAYMNEADPMARWTERETSMLAIDDAGDLTEEYFSTIFIIRDRNTPADEIGVATFSETGKVYYAHFRQAEQDESSVLTIQAFSAMNEKDLQANTSLAREAD